VLFKIDFEKTFDRVNWVFLLEILKGRGFSDKWIMWIQQILQGNRTYINFNRHLSEYFTCKRGVRQGDSLSLFLFDLVAYALHHILHKANNSGSIHDLGNFSDLGEVLNLHFADDTQLFLDVSLQNVQAFKPYKMFKLYKMLKLPVVRCHLYIWNFTFLTLIFNNINLIKLIIKNCNPPTSASCAPFSPFLQFSRFNTAYGQN
jgi:Reverse transcriptase (RNA-dependent DNA polymerase)